ncbi:MAG: NADH-quinone oxidoreductase subunit J [Planctomycetota bacterium]|nr:NADH-quinone oxidoreductase subunit J [Planctomycetota bacterium]
MSQSQIYFGAAAMILSAVGMWLMLPRGNAPGRWIGVLCGLASLVLYAGLGMDMQSAGVEWLYGILAVTVVVSAAAAVTFRNPVYCALWFALSLLGTAGLFMVQGAQFLGIATVVVYAGAILVTFLFVLMLAQPEGHAYYDRVSWEGMLSATAGAVLVGVLTMAVTVSLNPPIEPQVVSAIEKFIPPGADAPRLTAQSIQKAHLAKIDDGKFELVLDLKPYATLPETEEAALKQHLVTNVPRLSDHKATAEQLKLIINRTPIQLNPSDNDRKANILTDQHVARLGGELFGSHLVAIEVGGTLLLIALVGAIAIVAHDRPKKPASDAPHLATGSTTKGTSRHV